MKFRHRSKKLLELTEVDHAFVYVLLLFLCLFLLHLCATSLSAVGNSGGGSKLLTQSDMQSFLCFFCCLFIFIHLFFYLWFSRQNALFEWVESCPVRRTGLCGNVKKNALNENLIVYFSPSVLIHLKLFFKYCSSAKL